MEKTVFSSQNIGRYVIATSSTSIRRNIVKAPLSNKFVGLSLLLALFCVTAQAQVKDSISQQGSLNLSPRSYISYQSYRLETSEKPLAGYLSAERDNSIVIKNETIEGDDINRRYGKIRLITRSVNAFDGSALEVGYDEHGVGAYWLGSNNGRPLSIISGGEMYFYTNNRQNGLKMPMIINSAGHVGIGLENSRTKEQLHVNGNILTENNILISNRMKDETRLNLSIGAATDLSHMNLGTTSDHDLTLAASEKNVIRLHKEGYAVIYHRGHDSNVKISPDNVDRFSLFVNRGILTEDIALGPKNSWADYVFTKSYKRFSLAEVDNYITKNGHLPNMFTAEQIKDEGYSLHDMNVKLLEKVEELTLYAIEQDKKTKELEIHLEKYRSLEEKINLLEKSIQQN
ncbi:hypothetical protein [Sphingobacterium deserti]|uniref:Uncharacterized protein n=1 Tax=Sphingobacterium deserti TaxID=1229276 RepID=A0A0B8TA15_9SPHI|nr:hypothetical protein [Sphingobacterium deserti]KGE15619.1 hypothetical protein DI53_0723 [Sphingobacterium deserti]